MLVRKVHLQQRHPGDLRPARTPPEPAAVLRADQLSGDVPRALYHLIGRAHGWTARRCWDTRDWEQHHGRPDREIWVARYRRAHVGFAELAVHGSDVQIKYLGLMRSFQGRGLGGQFLTEITSQAWQMHERVAGVPVVRRVVLTTSSLDGPSALSNYLARGYAVVDRTTARCRPPVPAGALYRVMARP
jgi:GNAT superfamily N-acetyltransferase